MLLRITLVGIVWSVLFIEGIRVILLTNWHFDIFRATHWTHAWNLWRSGWVIDEAKEWAFIIIILTAIPAWATVWAALSIINWENLFSNIWNFLVEMFKKIFVLPLRKLMVPSVQTKVIKKKTSSKESRPTTPQARMAASTPNLSPERRAQLMGVPYKPQPISATSAKPAAKPAPKEFSHSLFELSDEDNFDFDLFDDKKTETKPSLSPSAPQSESENARRNDRSAGSPAKKKKIDVATSDTKNKTYHSSSTFEMLKQKGYEIISGVTLNDVFIDFVGISKNHICLCLNDKESGDWLADEERFNDEEPLWFSESSHRISPVRKIALAQAALSEKLAAADLKFKIVPYVIEQIGNIINAEDMFEIWKDLHINVTRIDRGTPKEIPLFAKKLEDADNGIDKGVLDKLKKLLRSDE